MSLVTMWGEAPAPGEERAWSAGGGLAGSSAVSILERLMKTFIGREQPEHGDAEGRGPEMQITGE